jgi:hypothetical protein
MPSPTALNAYRERIYAALKEAGYPVDQWHSEIKADQAAYPTARARPYTQITPPAYGKIRKLRPGFHEFLPHPAHGKPVPRCQAAKKRTGGKVQCGKFAVKGRHLCRTHGGGKGSGVITPQGRESQRRAVTLHGDETVAKRKTRRDAVRLRKMLGMELKKIPQQRVFRSQVS